MNMNQRLEVSLFKCIIKLTKNVLLKWLIKQRVNKLGYISTSIDFGGKVTSK